MTYAPRIMETVVHCGLVSLVCFYLVLGFVPGREWVGVAALLLVIGLETRFFDGIESWCFVGRKINNGDGGELDHVRGYPLLM